MHSSGAHMGRPFYRASNREYEINAYVHLVPFRARAVEGAHICIRGSGTYIHTYIYTYTRLYIYTYILI